MKTIVFMAVLALGFSAHAGNWKETVDCSVERGSVDFGTIVTSSSSATMTMKGPHNGEFGKVEIKNKLTPSYNIVFEKISGGRNEEISLTTWLGSKIYARASVDTAQTEAVTNTFVTLHSDYQVTITCHTN